MFSQDIGELLRDMDYALLKACNIIEPFQDGRYNFTSSLKNARGPHCHDFYEIFLVVQGNAIHNVNGKRQQITDGSLVFVRPDDNHFYERNINEDCQYINVSFRAEVVQLLMLHFKDCFDFNKLLEPEISLCVMLPDEEKIKLKTELKSFNAIQKDNINQRNAALRVMLANVFFRYFTSYDVAEQQYLPVWLRNIHSEMRKPENFICGIDRMTEISSMSREHICRMFKKYYNITPTEYINELRLNYAANLLKNSDKDIKSVCYDSGFNNIRYFYHTFSKKYNISPAEYKKQNGINFDYI